MALEVAVGEGVGLAVIVGVALGVAVGEGLAVIVGVRVSVGVGVSVDEAVIVGETGGRVGVGSSTMRPAAGALSTSK